ncbi:porin [Pedobacter nutrimenti]|nr:porin [Pedobacter nutrimenti]
MKNIYPSFNKKSKNILLNLASSLLFPTLLMAQNNPADSTKKTISINLPVTKITFSGMLQTQYIYSFTKNNDINGVNHPAGDQFSGNSFLVKRARMQLNAAVNDRINAVILVNFGDFSGNPQNKVLENAFIKYSVNDYVNFQVGQFRPQFGQEDNYPVDFVRSIDYSNQYYLFGANSWQSFQLGASFSGAIKNGPVPITYAIGVFNGNNRNQVDNDNGKIVPARVVMEFNKSLQLGLNGGYGSNTRKEIWAYGVDIDYKKPLNEDWSFELVSEYKQGINSQMFFAATTPTSIGDYQMRGIYVLPNLVRKIRNTRLKSLEFAFRYEYLDSDFKRAGNSRNSYVPMVSASFAESYAIRVQAGYLIDRYQNNIPGTAQYNGNRLICQVQARF